MCYPNFPRHTGTVLVPKVSVAVRLTARRSWKHRMVAWSLTKIVRRIYNHGFGFWETWSEFCAKLRDLKRHELAVLLSFSVLWCFVLFV